MLVCRYKAGDNLAGTAPMFALPLKHGNTTHFSPLTYNDIYQADKIRSKILSPTSTFPVKTHLRRRGGASDLFDCGTKINDIKVVGH